MPGAHLPAAATLNETHDPALASWVESANRPDADFPVQNLPFGVFRRKGSQEAWRCGVAIGDQILDLGVAQGAGLFSGEAARAVAACESGRLNGLMALGPSVWSALRLALSRGLRADARQAARWRNSLVAQEAVEHAVPATVGDYTDFYTSIHHASNIGRQFRPDNPLLPNYRWVPIGYHGRASSIIISGQGFRRPVGQILPAGASQPIVAPCRRLDYEFELGIFIGTGNALGEPIALADAESHVFGLCILNDWSARDIQAWEYQPLGPFLAKSFATTLSPWVVTLEALAPYRVPFVREAGEPAPLAYLDGPVNRESGAFDIRLRASLATPAMRANGVPAHALALGNYRHAYWTLAQLVAHHTVNGCNLAPGDLFGTGTLSGPQRDEAGALIELTEGGKRPVALAGGESRTFLEDGDVLTLSAWCEGEGRPRIGFGSASAEVLPAAVAAVPGIA